MRKKWRSGVVRLGGAILEWIEKRRGKDESVDTALRRLLGFPPSGRAKGRKRMMEQLNGN